MANQTEYIISDYSTTNATSSDNESWRLVTDQVMGGISSGEVVITEKNGRRCLNLRGDVKLENNGGFVQTTYSINQDISNAVPEYSGLFLDIYGNDENYNIHLRTHNMWLPWQSYRATFMAESQWQSLRISFEDFKSYRIAKPLDIHQLKRIGIVAIGREFSADLCIGRIGLYR